MSAVMNTHCTIAVFTPISLTRAARRPNSEDSSSGRPQSFTSVAPGAEKRSVIWLVIAALCVAASRSRLASFPPIRLAGMTKMGRRMSDRSVTCQESPSMTARVNTNEMTFVTTLESVLRECALGPDDVVVQPADERPRTRTGKEGDRHALDVIEHRVSQIQDEAFADAR